MLAWHEWYVFQLKYTAGEDLEPLADSLEQIVEAFEAYKCALRADPETADDPPFDIDNDTIDHYAAYLNLLSACVLLKRDTLVERVANLLEGSHLHAQDAVIEELLTRVTGRRPVPDEWFWEKPYFFLMNAIHVKSNEASAKAMGDYVRKWYPSMKGRANFWNMHEEATPQYTTYVGYWAMCAAAFTYLLGIDDSTYRDNPVYPKDMIDYARSHDASRTAGDLG